MCAVPTSLPADSGACAAGILDAACLRRRTECVPVLSLVVAAPPLHGVLAGWWSRFEHDVFVHLGLGVRVHRRLSLHAGAVFMAVWLQCCGADRRRTADRKSTRLNSSH